jgi:hypothetical protein
VKGVDEMNETTKANNAKYRLTGKQIIALMNVNGVTIRELAASMQITIKRVRFVRDRGIQGFNFVRDWMEGIETTANQKRLDATLEILSK